MSRASGLFGRGRNVVSGMCCRKSAGRTIGTAMQDEKHAAFEALAGLIERIVHPQANVVPLRDRGLPDADPKKRGGKKSS